MSRKSIHETSGESIVPQDYNHYDVEAARRRIALRTLLHRIGIEIHPTIHYSEQALHELYRQRTGIEIDNESLLRLYAERWAQKTSVYTGRYGS